MPQFHSCISRDCILYSYSCTWCLWWDQHSFSPRAISPYFVKDIIILFITDANITCKMRVWGTCCFLPNGDADWHLTKWTKPIAWNKSLEIDSEHQDTSCAILELCTNANIWHILRNVWKWLPRDGPLSNICREYFYEWGPRDPPHQAAEVLAAGVNALVQKQ